MRIFIAILFLASLIASTLPSTAHAEDRPDPDCFDVRFNITLEDGKYWINNKGVDTWIYLSFQNLEDEYSAGFISGPVPPGKMELIAYDSNYAFYGYYLCSGNIHLIDNIPDNPIRYLF